MTCCCKNPLVTCQHCSDGAPQDYSVVIAGVSDDVCPEADCSSINGTFVLKHCFPTSGTILEKCHWGYEFTKPGLCATASNAVTGIRLEFTVFASTFTIFIATYTYVTASDSLGGGVCHTEAVREIGWLLDLTVPVKCYAFDSLSIPFFSTATSNACQSDGTAALLTAI